MLTRAHNIGIMIFLLGFIAGQIIGVVFHWDFTKRCDDKVYAAVMDVATGQPVFNLLPPPEGMK